MKKIFAAFLLLMVIVSTQAQDPKLKKIFEEQTANNFIFILPEKKIGRAHV